MFIRKRTVQDINVKGKRVIARVDFNVPLDDSGNITNDKRVVAALPTINYLLDNGARTILVSHLGRPKGFDEKLSMKPVAERLHRLLGKEVILAADVVGDDARQKVQKLKENQILLLENVRFHKEETKNDPEFAKKLADFADVFVNDAFGTAHRAHASTVGIADYLPAVAGFLVQKELEVMGKALSKPDKPFVAILGGAKVSDKIGVIENLLDKVDSIIIGGGMAYTFLKAKGYRIGNSICEDDKLELAKKIMDKAEKKGINLMLPIGSIVGREFKNDTDYKYVPSDDMPDEWLGMDLGSLTIEKYSKQIKKAKTIVWNGPMGVFEFPNFATGTREIARAVAESGAVSIVGGGDSVAALEQLGFAERITHISTGGGASLEFLEGKELPGISVLADRNPRKKLIAGNWKMNKTPSETVDFLNKLKRKLDGVNSEVAVCVPFVCIAPAVSVLEETKISIGAQDLYWEDSGAWTGEVSGDMIKDAGARYVIIGHSERRQYFGETDETVNKKVHAAFRHMLLPIICVGESLKQRERGITADLIRSQVKSALYGLSAQQVSDAVIAYEPIWAIGTGKTATSEQANEMCMIIRETVEKIYDDECADTVRILYGGSVKPGNAGELFTMSDIDGGLVGGASLKADDFEAVVKYG